MPYGTSTNLVAGTLTLTRPGSRFFFYVLNQDVTPLQMAFNKAGVKIGGLSLSAASALGAPGGYIDSVNFPMFLDADTVVLTNAVTTTAQFACGMAVYPPAYTGGGPI